MFITATRATTEIRILGCETRGSRDSVSGLRAVNEPKIAKVSREEWVERWLYAWVSVCVGTVRGSHDPYLNRVLEAARIYVVARLAGSLEILRLNVSIRPFQ